MTGTTYDKLQYLNETKQQIKQAIIDKGQSISENDTFRSYVDKIEAIETGGGVRNQDKTFSSDGQYTADAGYTGLGTVTVTAGSIAATNTQNQIAEELMLVNDGTTVITITVSPQDAHFELSSDTNHITLVPNSSVNGVYTFNISADSLKTYTYSAYADGYESDTGTINGGTTTRSVTLNEEGPDTYNVTFRLDGDSPASFNHIDIHDEEGYSATYSYNDFEDLELTITLDSEITYSWEAYSDDDELYTVVPDCDEFYLDSDRTITISVYPVEEPEEYDLTFTLQGDSVEWLDDFGLSSTASEYSSSYLYSDFEENGGSITVRLPAGTEYSWSGNLDGSVIGTVEMNPRSGEGILDQDTEIIITINTIDDGPIEHPEPYYEDEIE